MIKTIYNKVNIMSNPSITAVITAYNEEKTIAGAIAATDEALKKHTDDYEVIVVNDCSKDKTGAIADNLAKNNKHLRVIHNERNMNIGYNLRVAVAAASKDHVLAFISADNYPSQEYFEKLLTAVDKKDIVIAYLVGYGDRPKLRRFVSWFFVKIMNILFWQKIRYYNGPLIVPAQMWRTVPMTTNGFAYMAEVTATLLKRGVSYTEVPFMLTPELKGVNFWALRRNIWSVTRTLFSLFWRLNVRRQYYN